jgi:hypothetical protein
MTTAALTPAGTALLTAIGQRRFSFFDDGIVEDSGIWEECLTTEVAGIANTPKGVALVARKLERDGYLYISQNDGEDSPWVSLTALGAQAANELATAAAEQAAAATQRSYEAGTATKADAEAAWETAFAASDNEAKEATMSTVQLQSLTPGQDFVYKGETLRLVKVNATSFRAEVASGEVKSFKARSTVKVETADAPALESVVEEPAEDLIGSATTTTTVKWQGKVRETKTTVRIEDHGKGADPRWSMTCEDHSKTATRKTSTEVWSESAHPLTWCTGCQKAAKA